MRLCIGVIAAAVLAVGCSSKPLQSTDGNRSGSIDAGGDREPPRRDAADEGFPFDVRIVDAPPGDAQPDFANDAPPFTGIRSFTVPHSFSAMLASARCRPHTYSRWCSTEISGRRSPAAPVKAP